MKLLTLSCEVYDDETFDWIKSSVHGDLVNTIEILLDTGHATIVDAQLED